MTMIGIAAGLALVVVAAAAPGLASAKARDAAQDGEREICKSQPVVGSRLKRVRTCMTAQQWEDLKLQEQVGLMRKQVNGDPGCNSGACGVQRGGKDTPW